MIAAYLAATIASVLWGASFLLTKITLTEMGPMSVAAVRWWIASFVLLAAVMLKSSTRRTLVVAFRREWLAFLGLGVIGEAVFYMLQNVALVYTTSVDVGLIMNAFPILTAVLGVWILGEAFSWRAIGGTAVATVGVTLITIGAAVAAREIAQLRLLGNLLAIVAVLAGSLYLVAGKRLVTQYGTLTVTALAAAVGAAALTPAAIWEGINLQLSLEVWAALLALALGCSVAAYLFWWYAADRLPLSRAGVFIYVSPIVSTLLGVLVLGEPITVATSSGAVLVLLGLVLVQT